MKRKITRFYALMIVGASLFVSCSTEEAITESKNKAVQKEEVIESASGEAGSKENVVLKETTLKELGYNSDEEMYADGWTKVGVKEQISKVKTTSTAKSATPKTVRQKLTKDQVKRLGLSNYQVKQIFKFNGTAPSGVTINKWFSSGAYTKFNVADQYGWHAYVESEKPDVKYTYLDKNDNYKRSSFTIYNYGSVEDSFQRIVSYTDSKTTHWHVNVKAGVTMKSQVGVPLLGGGSFEVSLEVESGGGESTEHSETHTFNYFGKLPAHTKRTVVVRQKKRTIKTEYKVPVTISGYVGLNFNKKKDGHYFWRGDAYKLLQGKDFAQLGSITTDQVYDLEIIASKDERI